MRRGGRGSRGAGDASAGAVGVLEYALKAETRDMPIMSDSFFLVHALPFFHVHGSLLPPHLHPIFLSTHTPQHPSNNHS